MGDATVSANSSQSNVSVRMALNGTPNASETLRTIQAAADSEKSVGLVNTYVPTGTSTITLEYASSNAAHTVSMFHRSLYAVRIA